jgi:hypothetical protein
VVIRKSSAAENSSRVGKRVEFRDASLPGYELGSRGTEWSCVRNWQLQNNGKKGFGVCTEDFMCEPRITTVL